MKKFLISILFLLILMDILQAAGKKVIIDTVKVDLGLLLLSFHVEEVIDEKVAEGLQKGLTSTIEYQIQLWEKKSGLLTSLVSQQDLRMKVFFDNWENKYVIMSEEERRLTHSLDAVREKCSQIQNFVVSALEQLKDGNAYFLTVKMILRPLSIENYEEIKHWLSGKAKNFNLKDIDDTEQQEKKLKGGLLKMFLSLTGFGDKVVSGKSFDFKITAGAVTWEK